MSPPYSLKWRPHQKRLGCESFFPSHLLLGLKAHFRNDRHRMQDQYRLHNLEYNVGNNFLIAPNLSLLVPSRTTAPHFYLSHGHNSHASDQHHTYSHHPQTGTNPPDSLSSQPDNSSKQTSQSPTYTRYSSHVSSPVTAYRTTPRPRTAASPYPTLNGFGNIGEGKIRWQKVRMKSS